MYIVRSKNLIKEIYFQVNQNPYKTKSCLCAIDVKSSDNYCLLEQNFWHKYLLLKLIVFRQLRWAIFSIFKIYYIWHSFLILPLEILSKLRDNNVGDSCIISIPWFQIFFEIKFSSQYTVSTHIIIDWIWHIWLNIENLSWNSQLSSSKSQWQCTTTHLINNSNNIIHYPLNIFFCNFTVLLLGLLFCWTNIYYYY